MARLTVKQKAFIQEYLIDLNGTKAAIRAGYSPKTAKVQAARLLTNVNVSDGIVKAMEKRSKRTEITQDRVIEELARIAFDDIKNYVSFRTEKVSVGTDENGEEIFKYKTIIEVKDSDTIDTRGISEVRVGRDGFKFKLYSKLQALEDLAKHLGMFVDKESLELRRQEMENKGW
jgi:phage terminase small subunit